MSHPRSKIRKTREDEDTIAVSAPALATRAQPTVDLAMTHSRSPRVTRASSTATDGRRATRQSASTQPGAEDDMGANESHEVNANLHTASGQRQGSKGSAVKSTTGKLPRVQKDKNVRKVPPAGTQRALKSANAIRPSAYEIVEPEPPPIVRRPAEQRPQISPRRPKRGRPKSATARATQSDPTRGHTTEHNLSRTQARSDAAAEDHGTTRRTTRGQPQAIAEAESGEVPDLERDHVDIAELQLNAEGQGPDDNPYAVPSESAEQSALNATPDKRPPGRKPVSVSKLRQVKKRKPDDETVAGTSPSKKRAAREASPQRGDDDEDPSVWNVPNGVREDSEHEEEVGRDDDDHIVNDTGEDSRQSQTQANTSRRRQAEERSPSNQQKLFKQWNTLQSVFDSLDDFGVSVNRNGKKQSKITIDPGDRDAQVTAIKKLCSKATQRFAKLCDPTNSSTAPLDPAEVVADIRRRVDGLRGRNPDFPTDFRSEEKSLNIYFRLIPALVRLLRSAIDCYLDLDKESVAEGQIKLVNLRKVIALITMITDLEATAKSEYEEPGKPQLKAPAHNAVALPLQKVANAFRTAIHTHELTEQRRKEAEQAATQHAQNVARNLAERERQLRIRARRDKWNTLHVERVAAETGFIRPEKRQHLSYIDHEYDSNGELFYRQEVFYPRVGPPPAIVRDARALIWSDEELLALLHGLEKYTGERVYERIFRRYCPVGQVLNRFNVTQIITMAAVLRENLIKEQLKDPDLLGQVQPWVTAIPVWIKEEPSDEEALVEEMENRALR